MYHYVLLNKYNCEVAIGHDRGEIIFMFKEMFPNKIAVTYQFGYWFNTRVEMGKQLLKNKKIDYYLLFDERTKNFSEKELKTNYIISGSISNNEKPIKNFQKEFDYMFISNFRSNPKNLDDKKNVVDSTKFFLNILSEFCDKENKKFCIAGVYKRQDKKKYSKAYLNEEKKFYKTNSSNFELRDEDSFELAQKSNVCVCTHSNLGFQLLSRGHKVIFLNRDEDMFKWHFMSKSNSGDFWYQGQNKQEIFKKLEDLLNMNKDTWLKILKRTNVAMKFDPGNKILKTLLQNVLKKQNNLFYGNKNR